MVRASYGLSQRHSSYALYIILNAKLSDPSHALEIGILQNGFLGLFGMICAFLFETPTLHQSMTTWGCILGLAILCSAFGLTLQPVAQSRISAEKAGLFCAISPISTSILGVLFLQESMTAAGMVGAGLIVLSVFIPQILEHVSWEKITAQLAVSPLSQTLQGFHSYCRYGSPADPWSHR